MVRIAPHAFAVSALAGLLLLGNPGRAHAQPKPGTAPVTSIAVPAPSTFFDGKFKLYFTPETNSGLSQALIDFVKSAEYSVDVAIFDIDHPGFVDALIALQRKGVKVRVAMDTENDNPVVAPLKAAGIVRFDNRKPFMHAKLVVVDGKRVYAGSANATVAAFAKEDNNAFFITSPELAARARAWIDQLYDKGKFGPGRPIAKSKPVKVGDASIEMLFAPEDPAMERVVDEIKKAKKEIRFAAFNLSHPAIIQALIDAKNRKVVVEGVVDGSLWLSGGGPTRLSEAGIKVLLDGNPSLMHDKVLVIDRETVVTGSFNFSEKATDKNDEDLIVIDSKPIAAAYLTAYDRILKMGKPLPKKPASTLTHPTSTPGITGSIPTH